MKEEGVDDPNSSLIPGFDSSDDLLIRTGNFFSMSHTLCEIHIFIQKLLYTSFKGTRF